MMLEEVTGNWKSSIDLSKKQKSGNTSSVMQGANFKHVALDHSTGNSNAIRVFNRHAWKRKKVQEGTVLHDRRKKKIFKWKNSILTAQKLFSSSRYYTYCTYANFEKRCFTSFVKSAKAPSAMQLLAQSTELAILQRTNLGPTTAKKMMLFNFTKHSNMFLNEMCQQEHSIDVIIWKY